MRSGCKVALLALMVILAVLSFSCGDDDADVDGGGSGGIANPAEAVNQAQDAADDAEQRAREIEDQANQQMEGLP